MLKKIQLLMTGLLLAAVLSPSHLFAQVTFKPDATVGEDVVILNTHNCVPWNWSGTGETLNFDPTDDLGITAWTIYAGGCAEFEMRTLIRFAELDKLCKNATIDYAELRLFGVPTSGMAPQGNSHYPGSPYLAWGLTNNGLVQRVTSPWAENTVTWNTQPGITIANQQPIPTSTLQWNENYTIPVTGMVQDMINFGNYGFKLSLVSETIYKNIIWASSDNSDPKLWPELYIKYHCCNPNFTYCSSTRYPNTWNFTAEDPSQPFIYKWDFGDGNTGSGASVSHTYTTPGSYKVCLFLYDEKTQKISCERCIEICITEIVDAPPTEDPKESKKQSDQSQDMQLSTKGTIPAFDGTLIINGLYPNPAHTSIDVNIRLVKGGNVSYKVYSLDGKEILSGEKLMDKGAQKLSIAVEKLASGMYILEMKDQYSKVSQKFSKE